MHFSRYLPKTCPRFVHRRPMSSAFVLARSCAGVSAVGSVAVAGVAVSLRCPVWYVVGPVCRRRLREPPGCGLVGARVRWILWSRRHIAESHRRYGRFAKRRGWPSVGGRLCRVGTSCLRVIWFERPGVRRRRGAGMARVVCSRRPVVWSRWNFVFLLGWGNSRPVGGGLSGFCPLFAARLGDVCVNMCLLACSAETMVSSVCTQSQQYKDVRHRHLACHRLCFGPLVGLHIGVGVFPQRKMFFRVSSIPLCVGQPVATLTARVGVACVLWWAAPSSGRASAVRRPKRCRVGSDPLQSNPRIERRYVASRQSMRVATHFDGSRSVSCARYPTYTHHDAATDMPHAV